MSKEVEDLKLLTPCMVDYLLSYYERLVRIGLIKRLGDRSFGIILPLHVYSLAANVLFEMRKRLPREVRVLDIGCGLGYGTNLVYELISSSFRHEIIGIDIDPDYISAAKEFFPDIDFRVLDASRMSLDDFGGRRFDLIIMSEVIEHIEPDIAIKILNNSRSLLSDSGLLIVSTPVREVYDLFVYTPGHINEMSIDEFLSSLQGLEFKLIGLYGIGFVDMRAVRLLRRLGLAARDGDKIKEFKSSFRYLRGMVFGVFFPKKYRCGLYTNHLQSVRCLIKFGCPKKLNYGEGAMIQVGVLRRVESQEDIS